MSPRFRQYDGSDPLAFVIGRNVHRRHLRKNQRVLAAARAATLPVGSNQVTQSSGLPIGVAAKVFEVSERNIARAKDILRHGTAELCQAVESGKVAVSRAADLCGLTEQEQLAKLREMVERKRTPRSAATGSENFSSSQSGAVESSQPMPSSECEFVIPKMAAHRRTPRDQEAAYEELVAVWGKMPRSVCYRFIKEVLREF